MIFYRRSMDPKSDGRNIIREDFLQWTIIIIQIECAEPTKYDDYIERDFGILFYVFSATQRNQRKRNRTRIKM